MLLKNNEVIISFTDGMSLSLGLHAKRYINNKSILIGGFMRLPDMENFVRKPFKKYAHCTCIKKSKSDGLCVQSVETYLVIV